MYVKLNIICIVNMFNFIFLNNSNGVNVVITRYLKFKIIFR